VWKHGHAGRVAGNVVETPTFTSAIAPPPGTVRPTKVDAGLRTASVPDPGI
jgi:hypothetical protein